MQREAQVSALLLALWIAGCAVTPVRDVSAFAQQSANNSFEIFDRAMAPDALVLSVEHDPQTDAASCGAHVLASIVNYWRGPGVANGDAIYHSTPPVDAGGYTIAELLPLARAHGLLANGVRLDEAAMIRELENGRPVVVAVQLPSIYVQNRTFPGANTPIAGYAGSILSYRVGRLSEVTGLEMVDHYLLVAGYDAERFVVVEPVMGYRTISRDKLARYRAAFDNAAVVFSGANPAAADAAPATRRAPG